MNIALDAMGGDFAPEQSKSAAKQAEPAGVPAPSLDSCRSRDYAAQDAAGRNKR